MKSRGGQSVCTNYMKCPAKEIRRKTDGFRSEDYAHLILVKLLITRHLPEANDGFSHDKVRCF